MTPLEAAILVLASAVAIIAGVALLGGLPWALIAGGVAGVVVTVMLYDPKTRERRDARRRAKAAKAGKRPW
jgi:predicted branched-subunit amino acid permease